MASTLEELQQQLIQGAQAQSSLTGLDERAVRANALRDREMPTVNQYGAASPFQQLDAAFGRYQGKRDMKAIDAERATAREQMAQTANALPLFQAKQLMDKRTLAPYVDQQGNAINARIKADGTADTVAADGTVTPLSLEGLMPAGLYAKQQASASRGGLTENQFANQSNKFRADLGTVDPVIKEMVRLDGLLSEVEGINDGDLTGDLPGIGFGQSSDGMLGDAVRMLGSQQGRDIHSAWSAIVGPLIRKQAGLAQTLTESMRVARSYGTQLLTDERTFRKAYPELKAAMQRDLALLKATTNKGVFDSWKNSMDEQGVVDTYTMAEFSDPFAANPAAPAQNGGMMGPNTTATSAQNGGFSIRRLD